MKTVLVVEDTEDLRELFVELLREAGYEARGAENGRAALAELEKLGDEPCLILLDLMMPIMDGHAFIEALRVTHRLAALPVVVVSAAKEEVRGARKVMKKPVAADAMLKVVAEFCGMPIPG